MIRTTTRKSIARLSAAAVFLCVVCVAPVFAQEGGHAEPEGESTQTVVLLWVNFAILVGGLAYLAKKFGGPFLAARAGKIQSEMTDAAAQRKVADERSAEVDRRLAGLEADRAAMRAESEKEIESQKNRVSQQITAEIAKIKAHAEQEIDAAGKLARTELKRYSAELAIALAEQKIKARMTADLEDGLVQRFVKDLAHPVSKAQNN